MSIEHDKVMAVVVRLSDSHSTETPWVAACMSLGTWEVIGEEDWQEWKRKALDLVLPDWRGYDIREVVLAIPETKLDALFAVDEISVEVKP